MDKIEEGMDLEDLTALQRAQMSAWMIGVAVALEAADKGQGPDLSPQAVQMWGDLQLGEA